MQLPGLLEFIYLLIAIQLQIIQRTKLAITTL